MTGVPSTSHPPTHALQSLICQLLQVMGVNGVSHHIVPDDLAGVAAVLRWLAFTPLLVGEAPPLLPTADPVERSIAYVPQPGTKLSLPKTKGVWKTRE